MDHPVILAFDCALAGCTIALDKGDGQLVTRTIESQREQAALLIPVIQSVLEEAQLDFEDLSYVVTTVGPGSFTGLRLGLAAAKTLSLALNIPALGVTTLELAARQAVSQAGGREILILLETKREDYYGQYFDADGAKKSEPFALPAERIQAAECYVYGDAAGRFIAETGATNVFGGMEQLSPAILIQTGKGKRTLPAQKLTPLYLRGADVSESKKKPIKIEGDIQQIL